MPLMVPTTKKRFESDFYVEGAATTFNDPYILFSSDGIDYKEMIDRHALDGADLSDVIFQYDHDGRVFARTKMGAGKPASLLVEPQENILFVAADLGRTEAAKSIYRDISEGLIYQMSWCFVVDEDSYDRNTHTRTILKIKKVYDVSAVSIPANPSTDISARSAQSFFDGLIEKERRESLERKREILKIKLKMEGII